MPDNAVQIILTAVDNASKTINGALSKINSSPLGNVVSQLTGFNLSSVGAATAVVALTKFVKQAADENVAYTSSIVDMARATGNTVENMSRFVQAADDSFISQEKLNTALSIGAKKGLDVTVDGIEKLADEYNALATPQEKAKLLNDNFGRSGLEMGKLLEKGSLGIEAAMKSISSSLVVTQESELQVIKYKKAVDDLGDAWQGVKYKVGSSAIPALTDVAIAINNGENLYQFIGRIIEQNNKASRATDAWSDRLEAQGEAFKKTATIGEEELSDTYKTIISLTQSIQTETDGYNTKLDDLNQKQLEAKEALDKATDGYWAYDEAGSEVYNNLYKVTQQIKNFTDASGENWKSLEELKSKQQELRDELSKHALVWGQDKKTVEETQQAYDDITQQISDLETAHDKATKKIVYDNLLQKLSVDGISDAEFAMAQQMGVALGIFTQSSADQATALNTLTSAVAEGKLSQEDFAIAVGLGEKAVLDLAAAINGLKNKTVTITTVFVQTGNPNVQVNATGANVGGTYYGPPRASGGPVYAGRSYMVGERGPEPFIPSTNGTILPNGSSGISDRQLEKLGEIIQINQYQLIREFMAAIAVSNGNR